MSYNILNIKVPNESHLRTVINTSYSVNNLSHFEIKALKLCIKMILDTKSVVKSVIFLRKFFTLI